LFVGWFTCPSVGRLLERLWMNFREIVGYSRTWKKKQSVRFWGGDVRNRELVVLFCNTATVSCVYAVGLTAMGDVAVAGHVLQRLPDQLKLIQKRPLRIIFGGPSFTNQLHKSFCHKLNISPLYARWEDPATRFFHTLLDPASCLHYLIPKKIDISQITKLCKPAVYEVYLSHEQINLETHLFSMH